MPVEHLPVDLVNELLKEAASAPLHFWRIPDINEEGSAEELRQSKAERTQGDSLQQLLHARMRTLKRQP